MLDFLLPEGAAIDVTDTYGYTAYDYAKANRLKVMKETIKFAMKLQSIIECF